ncbi:hypothetical protein GGX14DRAFT_370630 [Mycena pura]|uniref:Uncharacterized protein n=1 Tax=Mycena pura TaxID=153505 RepID=A0AAD6V687_9AGAR|nr:hypothetical protein GGX14DRAFT_370630 [Mycena pura]
MAWAVRVAHPPLHSICSPQPGSVTIPILDAHRRVVALLGGQPRDSRWADVARDAEAAMQEHEPHIRLSRKRRHHRRAQTRFAPLSRGISHGGGQQEPGFLQTSATNSPIVESLATHPAFVRIAGFTAALFQLWAPQLFTYYHSTLAALKSWDPALCQNFPGSPFAACTWNFGMAVCALHLDFANLAWGWCAVTALGDFDPDYGGHLILWDWKLVIRFPPGSTILIPSTLLRHSNTRIRKFERRSSFVQYTAGALFRWVDNQFMTNNDFNALASEKEQAARAERAKTRWEQGLNMFSKVDQL